MAKPGIRCEACYGIGLTDNHVTGEIECSACEGTGWDVLPVVDTGDELHQILGAALSALSASKTKAVVPDPSHDPQGVISAPSGNSEMQGRLPRDESLIPDERGGVS